MVDSGVRRSRQHARRVVELDGFHELDPGQPVEAHDLDHPQHLGLRIAQAHQAAGAAQAARDDRQVEDERAVGEGQLAEVDVNVALAGEGAGESGASPTARRNVLIPGAAQYRRLFGELDDG